jgi:O-6-methylguanine DNA methyltransferase
MQTLTLEEQQSMEIEEIIEFLKTDKLSFTFTAKGLKYLSLKNYDGEEIADLTKILNGQASLSHNASLVIRETSFFLETGYHSLDLDLTELTPFQQAVLHEVSKVPPGKTFTYKNLAEAMGKPGAAQAVGSAISKNPVCYFIPSHRILPQKGLIICRSGVGHLREKLLKHEGHDIEKIGSKLICSGKNCEKHGW